MAVILDNIKDQDEVEEIQIVEEDVRKAFNDFVKGMNQQEMNRFLAIYHKYQDKGQTTKEKINDIRN